MIVLIGGLQKHQAVKFDGICTTLSASMGMGGGYVPIIFEIDKELMRKNGVKNNFCQIQRTNKGDQRNEK